MSGALWFDRHDRQKARPHCGEPFSSRHPESASSARAVARPSLCRSAPREFIRCPVSEIGDLPHCSARAFGGSLSERVGFPVLSKAIHNATPLSVDFIHTHIPSANRSVRHGTCFRSRLSAHHAGAAPHSAIAELGGVRRVTASTDNQQPQNRMKTNTNAIQPNASARRARASFALAIIALALGAACIMGGQWHLGLILVFAAVAGVMTAWQMRRRMREQITDDDHAA